MWGGLGLLGNNAVCAAPPVAVPPEPHFESLNDPVAIPDGVVSDLVQDPQGMLWLGTSQGLMRFDGMTFTPIPVVAPGRSQSSNSFIRTMLAARDGRIWIGTESEGLAVYDPRTERWTLYTHQPQRPDHSVAAGVVRSLAEDLSGRIWVGTIGGGLQVLDLTTQRFRRYTAADGLPDQRVQHLRVDGDGTLWVGTWNGVVVLPRGATRLESPRRNDGSELRLSGEVVLSVSPMPDGSHWLGTQSGSLWRIRREGGPPERLDANLRPNPLGAVQAITAANEQQVWVGRAGGIELRDPASGQLLRALRPNIARPWGLAGADIRALVRSPNQVLWVAGYGSGLQRVNNLDGAIHVRRPDEDPRSAMARPDVRSLLALRDGTIWAGTSDGGIAILDSQLRTIGGIAPGSQGLGHGRVAALAQGPDGRVWVGIEDRVLMFPHAKAQAKAYEFGRGRVRRMLADREGAVWAATQDGLYHLAPGGASFQRVEHHDGRPLQGDVNAVVQNPDGSLWVGAEAGLLPIAAGSRVFGPIAFAPEAGLANANVLGLLIDRAGRLWVDTTAGLHRLRQWDGRQAALDYVGQHIARSHNTRPHAFGANLLEDEAGHIWTQRGVYDPRDQRLQLLSGADGVDLGTPWFRSYTPTADGRLLFGGTKGILVIQPSAFRASRFMPAVVATGLSIGSQSVPLSRLHPSLVLAPNEASFTLEFAALDLSEPARNRYRYRLVGHNDDWTETSSRRRQASYAGLAPGRYTLEVEGSNRHGDWSPKRLSVAVEVQPRWWQSWWGLLLALGALSLAVGGVSHWRTRLLLRRQAELEQRVDEATQALQAKSRELEESALSDPLTGLRNRRFIVQRMDDDLRLVRRQFEEALRRGAPPPADADLSFLMIDVDHFKRINDEHGHPAGDAVLVQMRGRLQEVFRESDYLVRWGGEEFLVVARGTSRHSLPELAERARRAVAQRPFALPSGQALVVSCSIGFACFPLNPAHPRAEHWSEAVALADAALYAAKREGRNRWVGVLTAQMAHPAELIAALNAGLPEPRMHLVRGGPDRSAPPAP